MTMRPDDTLALDLDGTPGSVRQARAETQRFLAAAALGATAADVVLVVAELVANACRHAPGPCRLTVGVRRTAVSVTVQDTEPAPLDVRRMRPPAGYGLLVVARLTDGIAVLPLPDGKIVRAEIPRDRPRPTLD